jgi:hypothetical protein
MWIPSCNSGICLRSATKRLAFDRHKYLCKYTCAKKYTCAFTLAHQRALRCVPATEAARGPAISVPWHAVWLFSVSCQLANISLAQWRMAQTDFPVSCQLASQRQLHYHLHCHPAAQHTVPGRTDTELTDPSAQDMTTNNDGCAGGIHLRQALTWSISAETLVDLRSFVSLDALEGGCFCSVTRMATHPS